MIVKCDVCEKEFEKSEYRLGITKNNYCSQKCSHDAQKRKIEIICSVCRVAFRRQASRPLVRNPVCSHTCLGKLQRDKENVVCGYCAHSFERCPSLIKRVRHSYCSVSCYLKGKSAESFVEKEFERVLIKNKIPYIRNDHSVLADTRDARRSLEIDFYIPHVRMAIEINGSTHYLPVYGSKVLKEIRARDKRKRKKCKQLGIQFRAVKPGNCRRETYLPRYKRVICEIKRMEKDLAFN